MWSNPTRTVDQPPIPLSIPVLGGNEWRYVKECLDTGWVSTAGPFVQRFEQEIARYTGAPHAVACVNGTAALHLALQLAGVRAGDEVLVPTVTFIASVNAIRYCQAEPVFMDCDEFYNLDVEKVAEFFRSETRSERGRIVNRRTGRRIAAVLPVHVFGNACRLDELLPVCREREIPVIEDAAESLGTRYRDGRHTGTLGLLGCLSFNGNKIITTGGGGMILTADAALAARAKYLTTQAKDDEARFIHHEIGYNYRLTNVAAALGVAQLERLSEHLRIKKANFIRYQERLAGRPGLRLAPVPPYADNNHWMYALQIERVTYGLDREATMALLARHGIQTRPLWELNHRQRPYAGCQHYRIERALQLWEATLNLPASVNLTEADVDRVCAILGGD